MFDTFKPKASDHVLVNQNITIKRLLNIYRVIFINNPLIDVYIIYVFLHRSRQNSCIRVLSKSLDCIFLNYLVESRGQSFRSARCSRSTIKFRCQLLAAKKSKDDYVLKCAYFRQTPTFSVVACLVASSLLLSGVLFIRTTEYLRLILFSELLGCLRIYRSCYRMKIVFPQ